MNYLGFVFPALPFVSFFVHSRFDNSFHFFFLLRGLRRHFLAIPPIVDDYRQLLP